MAAPSGRDRLDRDPATRRTQLAPSGLMCLKAMLGLRLTGCKEPTRFTPCLVDVREATVAVDADDLDVVYEEHGARLWRAILLYSGDPDVASDAVAEAFAQVLRRGDAVDSPERWIWRSAFRIAAGELSRRGRQSELVESASYEVPHETTELLLALPQLSSKQRRAIVLHYYGGYSLKEVATITGSTSSAIGVHLHRGRKRLRELLGDDDA
jgi:RNA polymerase sigma-70 factor, ECF subfamily